MTTPAQLALAKKCDARVRSLVATNGKNMAEIAYTLLQMREDGLHRALNESTIAGYAVKRGVTRSRAQARELVLVAARVQRWPRFKAAFDRGALCWTKVRDGLRLLEQLSGSRKDEARMLRKVQECTSRELERVAARARGRDAADVTHAFRHSPEREGRLEHALQLVRSRGSGEETDAEALARIVEEWLAAVERGDVQEVRSVAETPGAHVGRATAAPGAQGGQTTETPGAHGRRTTGRFGSAPMPGAHAAHERQTTELPGGAPLPGDADAAQGRLDGGRGPTDARQTLRVLPGALVGPGAPAAQAPGTDRLQLRVFGADLEVRITPGAILVRVPDLDTVVSVAPGTEREVPVSRTNASRESSSPASSGSDTTREVVDVSREGSVTLVEGNASQVAAAPPNPASLGSSQRVADAG